jgi:hypothetical protein
MAFQPFEACVRRTTPTWCKTKLQCIQRLTFYAQTSRVAAFYNVFQPYEIQHSMLNCSEAGENHWHSSSRLPLGIGTLRRNGATMSGILLNN